MTVQRWAQWIQELGVDERWAEYLGIAAAALLLVLLCTLANFIARRIVLRVIRQVIERSAVTWDDEFLHQDVFGRLSHIAPALVIQWYAPLAFAGHETIVSSLRVVSTVYMLVIGVSVAFAVLNAVLGLWQRDPLSRRIPLKGLIQVFKIVLFVLGAIFVLSQLLGKSPIVFFSGLGAFTAVLLLIFKDSILGLVAGVQLMTNNMVQVGDWIEMPKYGVDGDVIDVALTTVKVQNWDKTIATVPPYALVSDSFRNWRGMSESGGRRIKRSISLDMNSVKFCDQEMLERFKKFQFISEYVEQKIEEVGQHNKENQIDETYLVNGRHLTNLGTFRAYLEEYLRRHPKIHQDMTLLVRQLQPGAEGIPIQIYVFSNDQRWAYYEGIQADIFDHILAVIPQFDLRVFQKPSGKDLEGMASGE